MSFELDNLLEVSVEIGENYLCRSRAVFGRERETGTTKNDASSWIDESKER